MAFRRFLSRPLFMSQNKSISSKVSHDSFINDLAASRLSTLDPNGTVFAEFTALALKHNAVNLGQGFPTLPVAPFILDAVSKATKEPHLLHQYSRSEGHVRLVKALADFYSPQLNRPLDPMTEVMSAAGASEAIYSTIQAFVNPGDQVIMMQPFYDCYPAAVNLAGGVPVCVSLKPQTKGSSSCTSHDWILDLDELESKITPKTKMIMINNPHNPIGKVFTRDELMGVAELAKKYDVLVLADEVYETLVYSDSVSPMVKMASLPGMFERTISVGSAGKIFGVTGWKIGWCVASRELIRAVWMVHQFIPFCVSTPFSEATAMAFEHAMKTNYFQQTQQEYQRLRDVLYSILDHVGLRPTLPHGGYFILADTSSIKESVQQHQQSQPTGKPKRGFDFDVCAFLTEKAGVTAIPPSAFYDPASNTKLPGQDMLISDTLARFAFCKNETMLRDAEKRLLAWKSM